MTDWSRVRKIYKLNGLGGAGKEKGGGKGLVNGEGEKDKERGTNEKKELEILVLGSIALRGATN